MENRFLAFAPVDFRRNRSPYPVLKHSLCSPSPKEGSEKGDPDNKSNISDFELLFGRILLFGSPFGGRWDVWLQWHELYRSRNKYLKIWTVKGLFTNKAPTNAERCDVYVSVFNCRGSLAMYANGLLWWCELDWSEDPWHFRIFKGLLTNVARMDLFNIWSFNGFLTKREVPTNIDEHVYGLSLHLIVCSNIPCTLLGIQWQFQDLLVQHGFDWSNAQERLWLRLAARR